MRNDEIVVLVTIDDLRADYCGFNGYRRDTTPFLDDFAAENVVLEDHHAVAPSSPTSFRAILSSTYPIQFDDYDHLSDDRPYIAELLSGAAVQTVGINSNPYLSRRFGFHRGFDTFIDFVSSGPEKQEHWAYRTAEKLSPRLRRGMKWLRETVTEQLEARQKYTRYSPPHADAEEVNEKLREQLEEVTAPAFIWVHYMEPHGPCIAPPPVLGRWTGYEKRWEAKQAYDQAMEDGDMETLIDFYDETIRYVDREIENLVEMLEERFGDDIHIILTSDHGELFGEYGGKQGHPGDLNEILLNVPFILKSDREVADRHLTSHLDIVPTVLDIFGIDPPEQLQGTSLFEDAEREYRISEAFPLQEDELVERDYDRHQVGVCTDDILYVDGTENSTVEDRDNPGTRTEGVREELAQVAEEHRERHHAAFRQEIDDIDI
ncbi:MAG: sulfatase [Candidatus Nanohaloarchaea archaeon]